MPTYRVRWEIDVEAATPIEAAYEAWVIQHDPASTATVFDVVLESSMGEGGAPWEAVDLTETVKVDRTRRDQ